MTWKSFPINYLFLEIKFPNFSSTSKKVSSFFLPPSSSFSMAEIRAYVIQIAVPACVPLSKSPQPNGLPARSICPLSPPPLKSFSRLCSTNWVATMTVSFHPQCSSVCEYTLEPRDRSDGAHISRLGGCKTAHIHGADDSTVWPECVPDTLLYCAVGGWLTPPPTPDNVSRLGAVF